ncbi:hypothetical protein HDU98_006661 [Podochytrium sp. JEL0797]|nr:hypothetical protein HDU98_006661 [Podochytrium sp. JEL0797]
MAHPTTGDLDSLTETLTALRIAPAATLLGFSAWKSPPVESDLNPSALTKEYLATLLSTRLVVHADPSDFQRLKQKAALSPQSTVKTCRSFVPPESKPNPLVLVLYSFTQIHQQLPDATPTDIVSLFNSKYDILIPRNPLKKIMTGSEWSVFVCRPTPTSPLFIDRTESYSTSPGSVGHLFESVIASLPAVKYHRIYAVSEISLAPTTRVLLTGEIDCVSESLLPVEIKTKPSWVPSDYARMLAAYIQSALVGCESIVTGNFDTVGPKGSGVLVFYREKVEFRSLKDQRSVVGDAKIDACFENAKDVLEGIAKSCTQVRKVYKVRGVGKKFEVVEAEGVVFPVSQEMIQACAEAVVR